MADSAAGAMPTENTDVSEDADMNDLMDDIENFDGEHDKPQNGERKRERQDTMTTTTSATTSASRDPKQKLKMERRPSRAGLVKRVRASMVQLIDGAIAPNQGIAEKAGGVFSNVSTRRASVAHVRGVAEMHRTPSSQSGLMTMHRRPYPPSGGGPQATQHQESESGDTAWGEWDQDDDDDVVGDNDEYELTEEELMYEEALLMEEAKEQKWAMVRKCMLLMLTTIAIHITASELLYRFGFATTPEPMCFQLQSQLLDGSPIAMQPQTVKVIPKADCKQHEWTSSSPLSQMNSRVFLEFICVVYWIIMVFSGLGTELLFGTYVMERMEASTINQAWLFAQLFFPVIVIVAIQCAANRDALSMCFIVAGLWKVGFPETFGFYSTFLKNDQDDQPGNGVRRVSELLHGAGLLCHHSSACMTVAMLLSGYMPMTQPVMQGVVPILLQHLTGVLRYHSLITATLISLCLEVLFQWEVLSIIEEFEGPAYGGLVPRTVAGMLFAHWIYIFGSALGVFARFAYPVDPDGPGDSEDSSCEVTPMSFSRSTPRDEISSSGSPTNIIPQIVSGTPKVLAASRGGYGESGTRSKLTRTDSGTKSGTRMMGPEAKTARTKLTRTDSGTKSEHRKQTMRQRQAPPDSHGRAKLATSHTEMQELQAALVASGGSPRLAAQAAAASTRAQLSTSSPRGGLAVSNSVPSPLLGASGTSRKPLAASTGTAPRTSPVLAASTRKETIRSGVVAALQASGDKRSANILSNFGASPAAPRRITASRNAISNRASPRTQELSNSKTKTRDLLTTNWRAKAARQQSKPAHESQDNTDLDDGEIEDDKEAESGTS